MLEPLARDTLTKQATETLAALHSDGKTSCPKHSLPSGARAQREAYRSSRNIVRRGAQRAGRRRADRQAARGAAFFVTDFDRSKGCPADRRLVRLQWGAAR